jgi:hypothetical protein
MTAICNPKVSRTMSIKTKRANGVFIATAVSIFMLIFCKPVLADDCPSAESSITYGFKKIILLTRQASPHELSNPLYPQSLQPYVITADAVRAIKKNFASCWSDKDQKQTIVLTDREIDALYDRDNLVIVLNITYYPPINEKIVTPGWVAYQLYRSGHTGKEALPLAPYSSGAIVVDPREGEEKLKTKLNDLFTHIRPLADPKKIHQDWNGGDFTNHILRSQNK